MFREANPSQKCPLTTPTALHEKPTASLVGTGRESEPKVPCVWSKQTERVIATWLHFADRWHAENCGCGLKGDELC